MIDWSIPAIVFLGCSLLLMMQISSHELLWRKEFGDWGSGRSLDAANFWGFPRVTAAALVLLNIPVVWYLIS